MTRRTITKPRQAASKSSLNRFQRTIRIQDTSEIRESFAHAA